MSVTGANIERRLSGGTQNTDPNASLGGPMSTVDGGVITSGLLHNLWDDVTEDETESGDTEYRCWYLRNNHPTETWYNVKIWISRQPASGIQVAIGLDPAGVGDGTNTGVATTIPDESTAPEGVSFSSPDSKENALVIGDLGPGQAQAIWVRRHVPAGTSPQANDYVTIAFAGGTL